MEWRTKVNLNKDFSTSNSRNRLISHFCPHLDHCAYLLGVVQFAFVDAREDCVKNSPQLGAQGGALWCGSVLSLVKFEFVCVVSDVGCSVKV